MKIALDTEILAHEELIPGVYRLVVAAPDIASRALPGQFVQVKVTGENILLRRPISLHDVDKDRGTLTLVYREIGAGTKALAAKKRGDAVNCLGPLGHGFELNFNRPLLVGGGMGIAPLLFLAKYYGKKCDILMGGKNAREMFWTEIFRPIVKEIFMTTDDGSIGRSGLAVSVLSEVLPYGGYDGVITCGPEPMMIATYELALALHLPCQVSLEKRMACGLGACLSCSIATTKGQRKKVCTDGPVFWAEEVFA